MVGSDEDRGRSRRRTAEDQRRSSTSRVLHGQMIERLADAICCLHRAEGDEEREFLGLESKPRSTASPGLASKPVASGLLVWASKPTATIC
jgi:hypothetical protein